MANNCWNKVSFKGKQRDLDAVAQYIKKMVLNQQREEGEGQRPEFIDRKECDGVMLELSYRRPRTIYFTSEDYPPTKAIQSIAEHFGVNCIHEYRELSMFIIGRTYYKNGVSTDICLDESDNRQYDYNEDTFLYTYMGKEFESSDEIITLLLDLKVAASNYITF